MRVVETLLPRHNSLVLEAPLPILDLEEVALQEEEEDLEVMSALDFKVLILDLAEMTSQVLGVAEEVISALEDLVEAARGESIALEAHTEVVEALIEVDLLEYKVLAEETGPVDKVLVGCVKAPVVLEGTTILVVVVEVLVEDGVSTFLGPARASTLVEEEILVMIQEVRTLE